MKKYKIVQKYASDSSMTDPTFTFFIRSRNTGWLFFRDLIIELLTHKPMVYFGCGNFATLEEAKDWIGALKRTAEKENQAELARKEQLRKIPDNKVVWRE